MHFKTRAAIDDMLITYTVMTGCMCSVKGPPKVFRGPTELSKMLSLLRDIACAQIRVEPLHILRIALQTKKAAFPLPRYDDDDNDDDDTKRQK